MDWLYGKTVVVTGASSGIGKAMTLKLIKEYNCRVIGIGQSLPKMRELIVSLGHQSEAFIFKLFDVSQEIYWEQFAQELDEAELVVDLLINNAGTMPPFDKAEHFSEEDIQECFDINFNAVRYAIRHLTPNLQKSLTPGIVNISSAAAISPVIGTSAYSASKAALKAYTEVLIAEMGRSMYIAYACPGLVLTDIFRNQYSRSETKLMRFAATDVDKMASKIVRRIVRQKSRIIVGKDARFMNWASKHFPILSLKLYEQLLKHYKIDMFDKIRQNSGNIP